jgi:hypothetical protein
MLTSRTTLPSSSVMVVPVEHRHPDRERQDVGPPSDDREPAAGHVRDQKLSAAVGFDGSPVDVQRHARQGATGEQEDLPGQRGGAGRRLERRQPASTQTFD